MGKTCAGVSDSDSECDVREVYGEWMYDQVAERPVEETCDVDPRGSIKNEVDGKSESRRDTQETGRETGTNVSKARSYAGNQNNKESLIPIPDATVPQVRESRTSPPAERTVVYGSRFEIF
jgi:hypothetical protein